MIKLNVNNKNYEVDVPDNMPLLWVLRDIVDLKGTKYGCGIGQCGACTVHIDGKPARSCLTQVGGIKSSAGGSSSRAEMPKGLRKINADYWIDLQIKYFLNLGFVHIFIGLGYDHKKYLESSHFLQKPLNQLHYFINDSPENGSFSTLKEVLKKSMTFKWNDVLIMHIDRALPDKSMINALTNQKNYDVVKPKFNNRSGHPIKISQSFCKTLIQKADSSQLNFEIRKLNKEQIYWLEVNNKIIHYNLNTEESWMQYLVELNQL